MFPWRDRHRQFGSERSKASDWRTVDEFRKEYCRELKKIKIAWRFPVRD